MHARRPFAIVRPLLLLLAFSSTALASEWHAVTIATDGPVEAIESIGGEVRVGTSSRWFRVAVSEAGPSLQPAQAPAFLTIPPGALPDGRVAVGSKDIARAWLADATMRYDHRILGDAIEAGSLEVAYRDGRRSKVTLGSDAVFEDLEPRVVDLDSNGHEEVVVIKSYLRKGSALAVIGTRRGTAAILAETPPLGRPHRWLNPAGIADFDHDGHTDIAAVMMPHAVGRLELWTWRHGALHKTRAFGNVSNHVRGSRALRMSLAADFNGDGIPDLAVPSFDRRSIRLIAFAPKRHDIARVKLPSRAATNFGRIDLDGRPAIVLGLEDGRLVVVRR